VNLRVDGVLASQAFCVALSQFAFNEVESPKLPPVQKGNGSVKPWPNYPTNKFCSSAGLQIQTVCDGLAVGLKCIRIAGILRGVETFGHFPAWKSLEISFWSVSVEKWNNFSDLIF